MGSPDLTMEAFPKVLPTSLREYYFLDTDGTRRREGQRGSRDRNLGLAQFDILTRDSYQQLHDLKYQYNEDGW